MRKSLSIAAIALSMAVIPTAFAADENNVVPGLTAAGAPLGFHGVDPVAVVDHNAQSDGSAKFTAVHDGVAYYFATEANKKAFEQNPAQYVPAHGGFCTFGVSVGKKFDGDPRYADIRDGQLYVFLNEEIFAMYQKDPEGTIRKADAQWQKIEHTAATDL